MCGKLVKCHVTPSLIWITGQYFNYHFTECYPASVRIFSWLLTSYVNDQNTITNNCVLFYVTEQYLCGFVYDLTHKMLSSLLDFRMISLSTIIILKAKCQTYWGKWSFFSLSVMLVYNVNDFAQSMLVPNVSATGTNWRTTSTPLWRHNWDMYVYMHPYDVIKIVPNYITLLTLFSLKDV